MTSVEPAPFREAVAAMNAVSVRPEIELGPIRPPQRLAPFSYALGAEVKRPEPDLVPEQSDGDAFGRLILLYDPDGAEAWDGTMRLWDPIRGRLLVTLRNSGAISSRMHRITSAIL